MDENGDKIPVCKTFFLTTLGYNKNNRKAVRNVINSNYNSGELIPASAVSDHNPNPKKIEPTKIMDQ